MLRRQILSGEYAPGTWLPAERTLAASLGVHRRTVRAAVDLLAQEGLVLIRPNCRPIIRSAPDAVASEPPAPDRSRISSSRLIPLVMWHGGFEQGASVQQRVFWGMNEALAQAGYHGVFLDLGETIGTEEENATREAARLQYALDHGFGGIIWYAYAYQQNRDLVREVCRRVPLVLLDRMLPGVDADFVGVDNYGAMVQAVQHLIDLGHERIAYVTRAEPINTVMDRLSGYRDAIRSAFGPKAPEIILTANWIAEAPWPVLDGLFRLPPPERPTAMLCVNDYEAFVLTNRLTAMGLKVPDDVSVVGFDNIIQLLPSGISLTTTAQPFEEIGRVAARTLLERLSGDRSPLKQLALPANLIVRESTAPPVTPAV